MQQLVYGENARSNILITFYNVNYYKECSVAGKYWLIDFD